ncbi:MAG: hypothetical protein DSY57_00250 [Desulfobulbus sp.]|nr:MAG: hypothetical protein DSY57_00250 [Desulfobulbus sp.]
MIIHAQTGQYRSRVLRPGLRRRVAVRRTEEMSAELRRAVGITICAALFFLLAGGRFFHWITENEYRQVEQLHAVSASLDSANITLRAKKAGLLSPKHIEAVAAVRFGLHVPVSGQVHRL